MSEDKSITAIPKKEKPKDAVEQYLLIREKLSENNTAWMKYNIIIECITIGQGILPDSEMELINRVALHMDSKDTHEFEFNMQYFPDDKTYELATGGAGYGTIRAQLEGLEYAKNSITMQMSMAKLRKLIPLDMEIYRTLIKCNLIKSKKSDIDELLEKQFMEEIKKCQVPKKT